MEQKRATWTRSIGIYVAICSLYWFLALGVSGGSDVSEIVSALTGWSLIILFVSGIGLLTLSKWAWYPAVISIALCIMFMAYFILESTWDVSARLKMGFISFPLIICLIYLLLLGKKK